MRERIQKLLAGAGIASRRAVEEMILEGRIQVNGRTVRQLPVLIDPQIDKVDVDGQRIRLAESASVRRVYILMNKPKGVYTTNVAQGAQVRAIDLLPKELGARIYPVGRLDSQSQGLLLLTNDGDLTNRLTHPRYGVSKTYKAVVAGFVKPDILAKLERGVWVSDTQGAGFKAAAGMVRIVRRTNENSVLEIVVRGGRDPQIRKVLAKLGHKVRDLTRTKMGPLSLEGLAAGRFRELTPREVKDLLRFARSREERVGRPGEKASLPEHEAR
jgi:pseudouridine synthase